MILLVPREALESSSSDLQSDALPYELPGDMLNISAGCNPLARAHRLDKQLSLELGVDDGARTRGVLIHSQVLYRN
jgi:hypothetical protein